MGKASRSTTPGNTLGVDDGTVLRDLLAHGSSCLPAKVRDALVLLAPLTPGLDEPPVWRGQASGGLAWGGVGGLGGGVGRGLEGGREISDAHWAVTSAVLSGRSVRELPTEWIAEELVLIEAVERVKAWADFEGLAALARLREAVGEQCEALYDDTSFLECATPSRASVGHEADACAVDEVVSATGLSEGDVQQRLCLAQNLDGRSTVMLGMLARGEVALSRCKRVLEVTRLCDPSDVRAITTRVLGPCADGTTRSHQSFTRELRRQVVLHEPDLVKVKADAVSRRTAFGELRQDGSGVLTVTGDGDRVVAALDRVEEIARTLRSSGDERTLAALRSDVALDLLISGWPGQHLEGEAIGGSGGPAATGATGGPGAGGPGAGAGGGPAAAGGPGGWARGVRAFPPGHVNVVVSLSTLLGLDDAVAEIPGWGFITAVNARQIALAEGSIWRRLVTDPLTGAGLELSTQRYRPTRAMSDLVAALDSMCRGPGCTVPAFRCDNDHEIAWPKGSTSIDNLNAKHRRHHNHKTRGTWSSSMDAEGVVTWKTMGGRTYISRRHNYEDPVNLPVTDVERQVADDLEPPPF